MISYIYWVFRAHIKLYDFNYRISSITYKQLTQIHFSLKKQKY